MWHGKLGGGPSLVKTALLSQLGSTVFGEPLTAYVDSARRTEYGAFANGPE